MSAPTLLERERKVAELVASGYSNREIAAELKVTSQVVKNVLHSLFDKLGIWNRVELANYFAARRPSEELDIVRRRIDADRVKALQGLEILYSQVDRVFDELVSLACSICEAPIGVIYLADSDRHWLKAKVGIGFAEARRDISFCEHTIRQSGVLVVPDALKDARFARNPLVLTHPKIRFYAGAPLITSDGYSLGALCVIDHVPRKLRPPQLAALASLARLVLDQMQIRRELR